MEASENSISLASPVAQFLFLKPVKEAQCYHACHQAGVCDYQRLETAWFPAVFARLLFPGAGHDGPSSPCACRSPSGDP